MNQEPQQLQMLFHAVIIALKVYLAFELKPKESTLSLKIGPIVVRQIILEIPMISQQSCMNLG